MSRYLSLLLFLLGLPALGPAAPAQAESPFLTLLPGARAAYRFDYKGDRSQIEVALDTQGAVGVDLLVYTPAQVQLAGQGQELVPIGRGTHSAGHDSFWSGGFPAPGVYQVAVENHSPGVVLYRLSISGESVSGVASLLAPPPSPDRASMAFNTLTVNLPQGASNAALRLTVPGAPRACTNAYEILPIISSSIKLCPNQVYPVLHLVGNGIGLYSDDAHSAVVTGGGRQYAITVEGNGNLIEGVVIQASTDPADLGAWLCQYDECIFPTQPQRTVINGGLVYGGGILLRGSSSVIHGVTVHGGTIGIATVNGSNNVFVDNQLNDLNGWGIFSIGSAFSYFVGNSLDRENHGCRTPDGYKFLHGCETAGWVCLGCQSNVVARNHCAGSGNCFYMSGERGLASNNNRLLANYCAGATDNCFELTFSQNNLLQDNIATADPSTGSACKYPFWIGGSSVYMKGNSWQCALDASKALSDATASTSVPTVAWILDLADVIPPAATRPATPGFHRTHGRYIPAD